MGEQQRIAAVVGQHLRAWREAGGWSQDEVAYAARRGRLDWTRASVASLESGRRGLSAEEFLLLPIMKTFVDGEDHTLAELLEGRGNVRTPSGPPVPMWVFHAIASGAVAPVNLGEREISRGGGIRASGRRPDVIAYMAARDTERHVAELLGIPPEAVARAAWQRWHRGLTEERERRVAERAAGGRSSPRSIRAARGHVTRQLVEELRQSTPGRGEGER